MWFSYKLSSFDSSPPLELELNMYIWQLPDNYEELEANEIYDYNKTIVYQSENLTAPSGNPDIIESTIDLTANKTYLVDIKKWISNPEDYLGQYVSYSLETDIRLATTKEELASLSLNISTNTVLFSIGFLILGVIVRRKIKTKPLK